MLRVIVFLSALFSVSVLASPDNSFVVNQQKQDSSQTALVNNETVTNTVTDRWKFDPVKSSVTKFVFTLQADKKSYLTLICDRRARALELRFTQDNVEYREPDLDSITAYTPDGVLRDSIIVPAGPTVQKVIQFFDDTSVYYVILKHHIYGKFSVGAKASGDLGQNMEVCRGLNFRN